MIDGSEKHKRWLAFELRSSRVFEKRSNVEKNTILDDCLFYWHKQHQPCTNIEFCVNRE